MTNLLDRYKLSYETIEAQPYLPVEKKKPGRKSKWVKQPLNILENVSWVTHIPNTYLVVTDTSNPLSRVHSIWLGQVSIQSLSHHTMIGN